MPACIQAESALIVYDIHDRGSFDMARYFKRELGKMAPPGIQIVLVGNMCDKAESRVVTAEDGATLAEEWGVQFFETCVYPHARA